MTNLFQSIEFFSFLTETSFLEPFRFTARRGNHEVGVIQGFIQKDGGRLKRFLSRRAIINGGPWLANDITNEELKTLLNNCIKGLNKKAIYIETRNFNDYSVFRKVFKDVGFEYEPHYDFIINTESAEIVNHNMGKSRKRDMKVSLNSGATILDNPSKDEVVSFYNILSDLYANKVKTPLFPLNFFIKLHETDFSKFILVKYNDEIVGGTVLVFDDNTVYEWFACGKDGKYKNVFPSTMATYYGIKYTCDNGYKSFDMMGAGAPGDGGYGVREFKMKFGGELVEYGRFKHICNPLLYKIGTLGVKLLKRH